MGLVYLTGFLFFYNQTVPLGLCFPKSQRHSWWQSSLPCKIEWVGERKYGLCKYKPCRYTIYGWKRPLIASTTACGSSSWGKCPQEASFTTDEIGNPVANFSRLCGLMAGSFIPQMKSVGLSEISCRFCQSPSNHPWSCNNDFANAKGPLRSPGLLKGFVYCFNRCLWSFPSPNEPGRINRGEKFRYRYRKGRSGLFRIRFSLMNSGSCSLLQSHELRITRRLTFSASRSFGTCHSSWSSQVF